MAKKTLKLDFTGVETFNKAPEGRHVVKITKVEEATSQGGNEQLKVVFEVTKGAGKGTRVIDNFALVDTALWKLKSLLQAIGMKADGRVTLDLDKLVGKTLEIEVFHEEYEGRTRAKISDMYKLNIPDDEEDDEEDDDNEDEDEDEEEEKPKKSSKKSSKKSAKPEKKSEKKSKKQPEPEPEDDEDDDDDDDWDDDEE